MSESAKRLNEIWRAWSLGHANDLKKSQVAALGKLEDWLKSGSEEVVLRATQALLVDPEIPGIGKRSLFKPMWDVLQDDWPGGGTGGEDVLQLQAMLLAAWPRGRTSDGFAVLPMLASPLDIMRGREIQHAELDDWREHAMWADTGQPSTAAAKQVSLDDASLRSALQQLDKLAQPIAPAQQALQQRGGNQQYSNVGPHILAIATGVQGMFKQVPQIANALRDLIQTAGAKVDAMHFTRSDARNELLWWGHARYCEELRTPYRRIRDPETRMWWVIWEAMLYSIGDPSLEVEPAAAYVQEVLHSLDMDLNETRPLSEWLERLQPVLRAAADRARVAVKLSELACADAAALPVTWLRLNPDQSLDPRRAGDSLALSLDATLDRGQWAAWIFRELLLDCRFEVAS